MDSGKKALVMEGGLHQLPEQDSVPSQVQESLAGRVSEGTEKKQLPTVSADPGDSSGPQT